MKPFRVFRLQRATFTYLMGLTAHQSYQLTSVNEPPRLRGTPAHPLPNAVCERQAQRILKGNLKKTIRVYNAPVEGGTPFRIRNTGRCPNYTMNPKVRRPRGGFLADTGLWLARKLRVARGQDKTFYFTVSD